MFKISTAALIAMTIGGSTLVLAQQRPPAPAPPPPAQTQQPAQGQQPGAAPTQPPAPSPEDIAAFSDARIAALKAGLKLSPAQERNWPAFETTVRDLAKQRADRIQKLINDRPDPAKQPDPIAILRLRIELLNATAAELKRLADTAEPLYKSLDDGQKRRMLVLVGGAAQ
jgi:zinc resistance-associated protein